MTQYATDEDIALRASTDFSSLCPRDQLLASGSDGYFNSLDLWTLMSSSVDFNAYGLQAGQVVKLTKPSATFGAHGQLFVIQTVNPGAITLRRMGQPAGVGQPPSTLAGLTNVEFVVRTLGPQIQLASYDLDRRFGISDTVAGRRPCDLSDPQQLRDAAVLSVISKQYLDQSRISEPPGDVYAIKARIAKGELDEVLDRLALQWNQADVANRSSATTRFSTRIAR